MSKVHLKNVRLAFPSLFRPDDEFEKYGAQLLLEPGSENEKAMNKAIEQVAKDKWGAKAETTLKAIRTGGKCCLYDGNSKAEYDGFEGKMVVSATNKVRPTVVNKDKSPVTEADGIVYGGCYVNAIVEVWAQDNSYGKRINASLSGVQFFVGALQSSGGSPASVDEFEDISEGADAEEFV